VIVDVDVLLLLRRKAVFSVKNPSLLNTTQVRHAGRELGVEVETILAQKFESPGLDSVFTIDTKLEVGDGAEVEIVRAADISSWEDISKSWKMMTNLLFEKATGFFVGSDDAETKLENLETLSSFFNFLVAFLEILPASQ